MHRGTAMGQRFKYAPAAIAVILFFTSLAGTSYAQQKPRNDGGIIMPEPENRHIPDSGRVNDNFLVDIESVEVKETKDGTGFVLKGITAYPDGTKAVVRVKFHEQVLRGGAKYAEIGKGKFEAVWGTEIWRSKKFFPGNYELEVQVNPEHQKREIRDEINKKLGESGLLRAYRNHYVTVGKKEEMKLEEDNLREHYVTAIERAGRLLYELERKSAAAVLNFNEPAWRAWLDDVWRTESQKLSGEHRYLKEKYIAVPWPKQHRDLTAAVAILNVLSAEHSIKLYTLNNLATHEEDEKRLCEFSFPYGPVNAAHFKILLKNVWFKLRLQEFIQSRGLPKPNVLVAAVPPQPKNTDSSDSLESGETPHIQSEKATTRRALPVSESQIRDLTLSEYGFYLLAVLAILFILVRVKRKH